IPPDLEVRRILVDRGRFLNMESNPYIYIVNTEGVVLYNNRPPNSHKQQLHPSILESEDEIQKVSMNENLGDYYVVKKPIELDSTLLGWVVFIESKENLSRVNQEYRQLLIMITGLALLGWGAIYFLSRRLSKPITEVAKAARQVQEGNYDISLSHDVVEEEVFELIYSFKEMSQKLKQLEALRTELLAGVTHELKTPITSISGLLQAVNEGIVDGDEAREFLQISLEETEKMKKMVEDLLAFNTFAANAIPVTNELHSINELVKDFVYRWEIVQADKDITLSVSLIDISINVLVDPTRFQQVMTNLLNNAKHAIDGVGKIEIMIKTKQEYVAIEISDTGIGIPESEQAFIFERFYRGENKKYKVGGLGLGLPFSKMIAQVLGGDLELKQSSPNGTTFSITLPIAK
ncbi:HAMP domain-containing sensor histidine kinase, partial [Halalkalibacterium halodurans]|uniref:HAMP domain-containing sensor histidine kinase n=1 Tax=Halalkalibacterium halodurans TaxID=86665 RepID=UPI002E20D3FA|nr:HAMP domain-containing sensor histidine kinase [Halalkalibacterium halodurans]